IAALSSRVMMPCAASMSACAFEPSMSSRHKRLSTSIDALIACIASSGMLAKRPPHIFWPPDEEEDLDTDTRSAPARRNWALWAAMAMLAFAGIAILYVLFAAGSKPVETHGMARFATGAMRRLAVLDDPPELPLRAIQDDQGRITNLRAFRGHVLVVNLWA